MKKFLLATVALVALGATVPALAADLGPRTAYTKAPPAYAPIYNWTGFYIGGHIGGAFSGDNGFAGTTNSGNDGRFSAVAGRGRLPVRPNWVLVSKVSTAGSAATTTALPFTGAGAGYVYTHDQRGLGSVTGRIGYTWGPGLLYVKGGYAYSDYTESLTLGGVPQTFAVNSSHHDGYTVGAGLEYMFAQNWSGKIEYQYYDFGKTNFVTPAVLTGFGSTRNDEHTFKAGINYRFNLGGPVVAKY
jgi:outer membrane immunogenic protein